MRASRVLSLLLLLQTRGRLSATALAELLEVSVRTVHRDIEQLSAAGVPVYASRGRDGGFELLNGWRTQLTGLSGDEAEALFLAGVPGLARAMGLQGHLDAAELKLVAAMSNDRDDDPLRVRSRFHIDPTRWFADEESVPFLRVLSESTWRDETVKIRYESWTNTTSRVVSPLGIVVKAGLWYMVALSRGRPSTFRLSQIRAATPTGESFTRPAAFDLEAYWTDRTTNYERSRFSETARVRASPEGVARLRQSSNVVAAAIDAAHATPGHDGWTKLTIPIESADHAEVELLSIEIEVLAPPELRERLQAAGSRIAARHLGSIITT